MKSKMSFFNPTLLKKNVIRFAPAWAILLVILFLSLSTPLAHALHSTPPVDLQGLRIYGICLAFACGILYAALLFRYLHNPRAGYAMHAFPMTRTCLFVTNLVSGLLFYLVPVLVTFPTYVLVLGAKEGFTYAGLILALMGEWMVQYLCFYGIAVFAMVLTGRTVTAVFSYAALNFLFYVLPVLSISLVGHFFLGFYYHISDSIEYLAPLLGLIAASTQGFSAMVWVYAAIGLVLLGLSWLLYQRRHVERAGDAMAYGWAQAAFRVIFTVFVALCMSIYLIELSDRRYTLLYMLFGCFLGWFGAALMVERTMNVFKNQKAWLGFAIFLVVLELPLVGLKIDLLGTQRRVPETAKVESVDIWTQDWATELCYIPFQSDRITLTAPADIDLIRGVHQSILTNSKVGDGDGNAIGSGGDYSYYIHDYIFFRYHLAGGGTITRTYSAQQVPAEAVQVLTSLYHRPDVLTAWYTNALPTEFEEVTLLYYEVKDALDMDPEEAEGLREEDGWYLEYNEKGQPMYRKSISLTCKNPAALRDAILAASAAGRTSIAIGNNVSGNHWDLLSPDKMQLRFKLKDDSEGDFYYDHLAIYYVDIDAEEILACFR